MTEDVWPAVTTDGRFPIIGNLRLKKKKSISRMEEWYKNTI